MAYCRDDPCHSLWMTAAPAVPAQPCWPVWADFRQTGAAPAPAKLQPCPVPMPYTASSTGKGCRGAGRGAATERKCGAAMWRVQVVVVQCVAGALFATLPWLCTPPLRWCRCCACIACSLVATCTTTHQSEDILSNQNQPRKGCQALCRLRSYPYDPDQLALRRALRAFSPAFQVP